MTDNMIELGKRTVACRGFRWMRGMLRQDDYRYVGSGVWARWSDVHSLTTALHSPDQWPDLTDAATIGCLLALVRVAYGDPYASVWYSSDHNHSGDRWSYYSKALTFSGHATEAEALVVALEAAL